MKGCSIVAFATLLTAATATGLVAIGLLGARLRL